MGEWDSQMARQAVENLLRREESWKRLVNRMLDMMPNNGFGLTSQPYMLTYGQDPEVEAVFREATAHREGTPKN